MDKKGDCSALGGRWDCLGFWMGLIAFAVLSFMRTWLYVIM